VEMRRVHGVNMMVIVALD